MADRKFSRRAYLSSVAVAGSAFLAGCGGNSGGSTNNGSSATSSATSSSTKSSTSSSTQTKTSAADQSTTQKQQNVQSNDPGTHKPMAKAAATFQNIDAWTAYNGVKLTAEKNNVYEGSQSAHVKGGGGSIRRDFPVPVDLSKKDVSIAINVLQPRPTNVRIWMKDTKGNTLKLLQQINPSPEHPKGWLRINPSINDARKSNLQIESMLITVDGKKGKSPEYLVDDVRFHDKMAKKGKVLFTFDDASTNLYSKVFPILEDYGFKGSLAVPSDVIGDNGRMTQSELMELKKKGWEICSHSNDMAVLAGKSASTQKKKIEYAKEHLQKRGLGDIKAFMYPGGQVDQHTMKYVSQNHDYAFLAFKGSEKGLSTSTLFNPYFINRSNPATPEAVENQLKQVAPFNGIYTMYMHGVDDGKTFPNTPSELRDMCEHVKTYQNKGKVDVVTPSDLKLPK